MNNAGFSLFLRTCNPLIHCFSGISPSVRHTLHCQSIMTMWPIKSWPTLLTGKRTYSFIQKWQRTSPIIHGWLHSPRNPPLAYSGMILLGQGHWQVPLFWALNKFLLNRYMQVYTVYSSVLLKWEFFSWVLPLLTTRRCSSSFLCDNHFALSAMNSNKRKLVMTLEHCCFAQLFALFVKMKATCFAPSFL